MQRRDERQELVLGPTTNYLDFYFRIASFSTHIYYYYLTWVSLRTAIY